jgi:hypothetical protein
VGTGLAVITDLAGPGTGLARFAKWSWDRELFTHLFGPLAWRNTRGISWFIGLIAIAIGISEIWLGGL